MLDEVLGSGAHAMAAGLARDEQQVCAGQPGQQAGVQGRVRVFRVGHLGLYRAVVLGPGVHALEDGLHGPQAARLPVATCGQHVGMHAVAPAADFAMHGPDHECVAALRLQRVQVLQRAWQHGTVARRKGSSPHLRGGNGSERGDRTAIAAQPEGRMGHVVALVGIEGDGDVVDAFTLHTDEACQALHVRVRTRHGQRRGYYRSTGRIAPMPLAGQIAEIILGVDDEQVDGAGHGSDANVRTMQCRQPQGRVRPPPSFECLAGSTDAQQRQHYEEHGQHEEHHEQHLRNGGRAGGDAAETQRTGDERDDGDG